MFNGPLAHDLTACFATVSPPALSDGRRSRGKGKDAGDASGPVGRKPLERDPAFSQSSGLSND